MENLKNVAVSVLMLTHNRETMVGRATMVRPIKAERLPGNTPKRMSVSGYFAAMTAILAQGAIWR